MSWNYRIVRYADGSGSGLHEVFYDAAGVEISMTELPVDFYRGAARDRALAAARELPIFDEPAEWAKPRETKECER